MPRGNPASFVNWKTQKAAGASGPYFGDRPLWNGGASRAQKQTKLASSDPFNFRGDHGKADAIRILSKSAGREGVRPSSPASTRTPSFSSRSLSSAPSVQAEPSPLRSTSSQNLLSPYCHTITCHGCVVRDAQLQTLSLQRSSSAPHQFGAMDELIRNSRRFNNLYAGNRYRGSAGGMIGA